MDVRPSTPPVSLAQVAKLLKTTAPARDVALTGITVDSRKVHPGDLFVALSGQSMHGASRAAEAVNAGAVAVLTDGVGAPLVKKEGVPVLVVVDPRSRVGDVAAEIYAHPARQMLTLAVTGTNGKTTTSWLLDAGLRAAGHTTGLVGTVETRIGDQTLVSARTTPEAPELHALLAVMRERGVTAVTVEVSSHALALGRVDGCTFDVAGFTHLGQDHLDFHGTRENYLAAKLRLFTPEHTSQAVVCVDDEAGQFIAQTARVPMTTLSAVSNAAEPRTVSADWQVDTVRPQEKVGYTFSLVSDDGQQLLAAVALVGRFNVANAALAVVMLQTAGLSVEAALQGVRSCAGVPGRMQVVNRGQLFLAVVDYAHTPNALRVVLEALRPEVVGNLIVVLGCGGDRDRSKRAPMGEAASRLADLVVVTDDNPRSENPASIRADVLAGATSVPAASRAQLIEEADRRVAIERAVEAAGDGDAVVVAGKGHETGQESGDQVLSFDDRVVLADAIQRSRAVR